MQELAGSDLTASSTTSDAFLPHELIIFEAISIL